MNHYMIDENYIKATICLYSFKKVMRGRERDEYALLYD